jgi:predicted dehydrogenase
MQGFPLPNRRTFLRDISGAAAAPMIVAADVLGRGATPPSDRIVMGIIGAGPRGMYVLTHFMKESDVRMVAVADCFANRREEARQLIDKTYGTRGCASYRFHEELLGRSDIDAVLIATGDRWHSVLSVLAARCGKDIYCEKPISLTIGEGRAMAETIKSLGTVWQNGTQRKSIPGYGFVRDVVNSGRIGKLHTITASMGAGWTVYGQATPAPPPDPSVFDYERWLGQAPWAPYSPLRVQAWRNNWDTSGGPIVDMGPHYCEFAQWVHGERLSVPVEYQGTAAFLNRREFQNTPYFVNVTARYDDGVTLMIDSKPKGVRFDGEKGWVQLFDEGRVESEPESVLQGLQPPEANWKVMHPHIRNFLECVRTRETPVSSVETAQRAHTIVHCANLALRLGRRLRFDPQTELFFADDEANNMLVRGMRAPWSI